MIRKILCIGAFVVLLPACQSRIESQVCRSLVVSDGEAICILPVGLRPHELVGPRMFGARTDATLRDRLSSLKEPTGDRIDQFGRKWYLFSEDGVQLEAACLAVSSVANDNQCFWQLRSVGATDGSGFDSRLRAILEEVKASGRMQNGSLHLISAKGPDGSEESIDFTIDNERAMSAHWYDPIGSRGLALPWQSP